ncbi:MAG: PhzF family phenazine biosynthesis protein [Acidobacteriota bacterium]|jgi:PhzF family phenazine biosynthesis protein
MKLYQVDAFTDEPFKGNPAGVCVLDGARGDAWMQALASEMNLSETAFVEPGDGPYRLRWFTPSTEVDLCGHATLASAHILWETGLVKGTDSIAFDTRSGVLSANRAGDWIELDFPATPEEETPCNIDLDRGLGATPIYVGKSKFDFLVELPSEQVLRDLKPDFIVLERAKSRGIIVTAHAAEDGYDFVSRFFAPQCGVDEDPVTGSSHCCLAPYWSKRLGKDEMVAYQASARGGTVRVRVDGSRVVLGGQAVTVFDADLL